MNWRKGIFIAVVILALLPVLAVGFAGGLPVALFIIGVAFVILIAIPELLDFGTDWITNRQMGATAAKKQGSIDGTPADGRSSVWDRSGDRRRGGNDGGGGRE